MPASLQPNNLTKEKNNGHYYTPEYLVNNILDLAGYQEEEILQKHVIDNSCGAGAFLLEIVRRYCAAFLKKNGTSQGLATELATYIHAIELEQEELTLCQRQLEQVTAEYGLETVNWDLNCADTLTVTKYNGQMDFVLGNPPYIRVHNLAEKYTNIKEFSFAQKGMTDIYIVFYEIGLRMLNVRGVLAYITPSSLFHSIASRVLRQYLVKNKKIKKVVDLQHHQPFAATTYTTVVVLQNNYQSDLIDFYFYDEARQTPTFVNQLKIEEVYFQQKLFWGQRQDVLHLRTINQIPASSKFVVKNGFATLADSFFIGQFKFPEYMIPILKASTGKLAQCLFPYRKGKIVPWEEIEQHSTLRDYYLQNKALLTARSLEKNSIWYGFGRSQGLKDLDVPKIAVNSLFKTTKELKINFCPAGTGVYSGLYILTTVAFDTVREILWTDEFVNYVKLLAKYKSQGYYTFSSQDLLNYLSFKYK